MGKWSGIKKELEGVDKASKNVPLDQLAKYIYDRCCSYVGPDHEGTCIALILQGLNSAYSEAL